MTIYDALGYSAAFLVFSAFFMRSLVPLRILALCSNLAFLVYGLGYGLAPVYVLHAALIPINAWRLWEATRVASCSETPPPGASGGQPDLAANDRAATRRFLGGHCGPADGALLRPDSRFLSSGRPARGFAVSPDRRRFDAAVTRR